jgi:hypothetical protein
VLVSVDYAAQNCRGTHGADAVFVCMRSDGAGVCAAQAAADSRRVGAGGGLSGEKTKAKEGKSTARVGLIGGGDASLLT